MNAKSQAFFQKHLSLNPAELRPVLWVDYSRLTLVNLRSRERVTIDLELTFAKGKRRIKHSHLVIVEIKQQKEDVSSSFVSAIRQEKRKMGGMSKYCFGVASMHSDIKSNRFKQRMRLFEKLKPLNSPTPIH